MAGLMVYLASTDSDKTKNAHTDPHLVAGDAAVMSWYDDGVLDRADALRAPLLLHIAGEDPLCPAPAQAAIRQALGTRPGVRITLHPGVGHAFARRGSAAFDRDAATRADGETAAFLAAAMGTAA